MELCFNGVIEILENRGNLKFIDDKVDSGKMGMIINEVYKPPFPRWGPPWRDPKRHYG